MADRGRKWRRVFAVVLLLGLSACTSLEGPGYLLQSIDGHLDLMRRSRPIDALLADPATDAGLRAKLEFVRRARRFASERLGLPDNGSYTRYAALDRPFVLWNVFAAPRLSLELRQWCFPVAGCISYRGYYSKADAERFAAELASRGFDTQVAGVPAYSTLGWFDDPVPSTMLRYPELEIARLIFHELAHQVVYLPGDSTFNESFATAVEEAGVRAWIGRGGETADDVAAATVYAEYRRRREDFLTLLRGYRARLASVYRGPGSEADKLKRKRELFDALRKDYRSLRAGWGGYAGYDRWFDRPLGNAHLAAIGTYTDLLPGFRRLLASVGGDLPAFYEAVRRLADLPAAERLQRLGGEGGGQASGSG